MFAGPTDEPGQRIATMEDCASPFFDPFGLSLSKPSSSRLKEVEPFDRLRANGRKGADRG